MNVSDESQKQITFQCTQNNNGCIVTEEQVRVIFTTKNIIVKFKRNADDIGW